MGAGVMAPALNAVQQNVILLEGGQLLPPPLGVKRPHAGNRFIIERTVDLEKEAANVSGVLVFHGDAGMGGEGHGQETVHAAPGIHGHGEGGDLVAPGKAVQEEIPQRRFHGGRFLAVPVHPEHQIPQDEMAFVRFIGNGEPNVLNDPAARYVHQRFHRAGRNAVDAGGAFPGKAQRAVRMAGPALFARSVFAVDGAGTSPLKQWQAA